MTITRVIQLNGLQKQAIFDLWNAEYPEQIQFADQLALGAYLIVLQKQQHYFVENQHGEIQAWAFTFEREYEKWFAIIVNGKYQCRGIGMALLNELKKDEKKLNGWVIDSAQYKKISGEDYVSPVAFYMKNGFSVHNETRLNTEKLSAIKIKWSFG